MLGYIKAPDDGGYTDIHCPFCGHIETLDNSIEGVWECEACAEAFWITPMTLITAVDPEHAGSPFQYQSWTPITANTLCVHEYQETTDSGTRLCMVCGQMDAIALPKPDMTISDPDDVPTPDD